jgi:hypothetical protein
VWLVSRAPFRCRSPLIRASGFAFPLGAEVLVEPGPVPDRDEVGQQSRPGFVDQSRPAQGQLAADGRPGQADGPQRTRSGRGQPFVPALAGSGVALDGQVLGHQRGHRGRGQLGVPQHQVACDRAAGQADRAHRAAPVGWRAALCGTAADPGMFQRQLAGDSAAAQQRGALPATTGRLEFPA